MIDIIANLNKPEIIQSQLEIFTFEFFPGWILVFFVALGCVKIAWDKIRNRNRLRKQGPREVRKKMALPIVINTPVTQELSIHTYDISLTGAFLPYDDLKNSMTFISLIGKRTGIRTGDLLEIKVYLGRFSQLNCKARVVRYNFSDDNPHPKGIGIEFVNLSQRKKKLLAAVIYKEESVKSA